MQIASSPTRCISCLRRRANSLWSITAGPCAMRRGAAAGSKRVCGTGPASDKISLLGSMHRVPPGRRGRDLGVQQQHTDTDEFDYFAERAFVFLAVGVLETCPGDGTEIAQDFRSLARQAVLARDAGQAEPAQEPAAPFDQRIGAALERGFGRGQQRFEAGVGVVQALGAVAIDL